MGVYFSPTKSGKRRRVDIKIWPYIQKPYASLYFTGGKYFNRSMRLYAKRKFNWKLNDKGLFDLKTGERVITTVCTEKDLFDKLQLIYKAPRDRKFFDDVHPIAASI
jgi:DNA polymerase/3'-5' exonuclease PolX